MHMTRSLCHAALCLPLALQAALWETRDDFSRYPAGSEAAPAWETTTVDWEVREQALHGLFVDKGFACTGPAGRQVVIEATLTLREQTGDQWKVAGVALYQGEEAFWQLAVVEAPDSAGRRHIVELAESLDGQWLAQSDGPHALAQTRDTGWGFDWQYNRPYRLRLVLTAEGIRGTLSDPDGTVRTDLAYRFDAQKAVRWGRPALVNGGFHAVFDDAVATVDDPVTPPVPAPPPPCPVAGDAQVRAAATGFFHTAQVGDRWWLVTPGGEGFYMVGTDHIRFEGHGCEALGYAPYGRQTAARYGTREAWCVETLRRLTAWRFNTLGTGHTPELRRRGLPHPLFLSLGVSFARRTPLVPVGTWTGFPDVFDPRFAIHCDREARRQCAPQRNDPWLIGYFLDNELEWWGKAPHGPLFNWAVAKPAGSPCKTRLAAFFRERYADVAAFNAAWGTRLTAWEELAPLAALPAANSERAAADRRDFLVEAWDRYFAATTAAIRRHDPNHLVLGCRFAGSAPEGAWAVAGRYCDIVSLNLYPRLDLQDPRAPEVARQLTDIQAQARKPLMLTEWSFPALDATDSEGRPLPSRNGAGMRVDTQAQKAAACRLMQQELFALPFMVGSFYFMYLDEPSRGISSSFPEDSNYGLVNERDEPYTTLTTMFTELNARVHDVHAARAALPPPRPAPALPWTAGASGVRPASARPIQVSRDGQRLTVDNGRLRLEHRGGGQAWDAVRLDGVELGRCGPLVQQQAGERNAWTAPDRVTRADASATNGYVQVDMEFERAAATDGEAFGYRLAWQVVIWPDTPACHVSLRWLESTDARPWRCVRTYVYVPSAIGGDAAGDRPHTREVPNYYQPFAAWEDRAAGLLYGVMAVRASEFETYFWLDENGGQHPDAGYAVEAALQRDTRLGEPQPWLAVFGAPLSADAAQVRRAVFPWEQR